MTREQINESIDQFCEDLKKAKTYVEFLGTIETFKEFIHTLVENKSELIKGLKK